MNTVELRSVANLSPLVEVQFAGARVVETFQYDKPSEPFDASDGTFENLIGVSEPGRVDIIEPLPWGQSPRALDRARRPQSP